MVMNSLLVVCGGRRFRDVTAAAVLILIAATAAGCGEQAAPAPEPRPVRTVTVEDGRKERPFH